MQTLALQLTTTFADDAIGFAKGLGRIVVHLATAPVERIARACDVAGVLEQRCARPRALSGASSSGHGRNPRKRSLSPFAGLSELT
ncbi:hypothetical protein MTX26_33870 [Bradyrhizobium sp. ISRA443]|uniref:hypothetical protein n=1 Tax=unclassified Bradyrhizobium TaxID=2631580 RepID=UPI002478F641|nr:MULTISPECIES: hypothetical protein [unclassified Bradyrhizobium]WGR94394.1 hypothetical protein MTX20_08970 [Bradyrhizobium sp. ISRA435]WGR99114.1 hypothetical protein MTX23_33850 [Bradyrhizobium sp. ISRA436]WGS06005.1 hypothetical protein MTX18_33870 [Bradyrhizobium sp. ISRA437]WGS12891.1 hypothetical protein MTX26_33870 [Bradyrhizobium sp. ISRA443]